MPIFVRESSKYNSSLSHKPKQEVEGAIKEIEDGDIFKASKDLIDASKDLECDADPLLAAQDTFCCMIANIIASMISTCN